MMCLFSYETFKIIENMIIQIINTRSLYKNVLVSPGLTLSFLHVSNGNRSRW